MKHILSLAFAQDNYHFDEIVDFQGEKIRLTQYSTNFDPDLTEELIRRHDGVVDVICLSGLPPKIKMSGGVFIHPQSHRLKTLSKKSPTVDGQLLKEVYLPWAFRQFYLKNSALLSNKKISFYSGALQKPLLEVMEEFNNKVLLADPYFFGKMPFCLESGAKLEKFVRILGPIFKQFNLKRSHVAVFDPESSDMTKNMARFFKADLFVGNETTFNLIDLKHLQGKMVITDFMGPKLEQRFKDAGVQDVLVCMPRVIDNKVVNFPILEGIFQSFNSFDSGPMCEDSILSWIDELNLRPTISTFNTGGPALIAPVSGKTKFAFIIHPLSASHVFKHPLLKYIKPFSKPIEPLAEDVIAMMPGFFYGKIKGVVSEKNGQEIEGLIYTVTETPKKLMEKPAEVIYKKLVALCDKAHNQGASIIGLGAYTKIVGDAGVSVARLSPIPVTTGNSLSACSTLWAAKFALEKMKMVERIDGVYQGKVMVVGATGSIGAVSAKILAGQWKEIVIVAPRAYKLLELKEEILAIHPDAEVHTSTSADTHSPTCDLIVTTTSSRGKKILNIEDVKPGCVICDVSRPFDITEEDALKRPDVMVIASGEVQLPGKIKMKLDLGLEGNIVYACLAETALLAMEGRLESFTLSRSISYEKVLEIDKMAREHGVRLSCIMGHSGFITDKEFELCRQHATQKLKEREKTEASL
jgi:predicted amino acid dehydrogenase